jgi:uncharacterized protein
MSGKVVHFELPADDIERARSFYQEAFGWQAQSVPDLNYTLVTTTPSNEKGPTEPGSINGGLLARQAPFAAPVVVIEVDDIDAALERIETLGGATAVGRQAVGTMGFTGYFHDCEGNLVGLWQSAS